MIVPLVFKMKKPKLLTVMLREIKKKRRKTQKSIYRWNLLVI